MTPGTSSPAVFEIVLVLIGLALLTYVVGGYAQWRRTGVLKARNPFFKGPSPGSGIDLAPDERPTHELRDRDDVYVLLGVCTLLGLGLAGAAVALLN